MDRLHSVSENELTIKQGNDTWFFDKRGCGIEVRREALSVEGYEEDIVLILDADETKSLFSFLKQSQFY